MKNKPSNHWYSHHSTDDELINDESQHQKTVQKEIVPPSDYTSSHSYADQILQITAENGSQGTFNLYFVDRKEDLKEILKRK